MKGAETPPYMAQLPLAVAQTPPRERTSRCGRKVNAPYSFGRDNRRPECALRPHISCSCSIISPTGFARQPAEYLNIFRICSKREGNQKGESNSFEPMAFFALSVRSSASALHLSLPNPPRLPRSPAPATRRRQNELARERFQRVRRQKLQLFGGFESRLPWIAQVILDDIYITICNYVISFLAVVAYEA